ncbi:ras and ef-hand domain-containing protein [Anaeramoeba flamelloides]|uniref:Ras and ef-hand domain-containing protein n=1 Tax=Anaeramoeba flamelloides TaxID=1746091 RepID=A0ABQ8X1I0_9EUKA|nr:ras and ef-hand domain-containing protein [Anaeramoeba flamelloides]
MDSLFILNFKRDNFSSYTKSTIGVEFASKNLAIEDSIINAQIWDTAGQEKYHTLSKVYFRGAVGVLLVYDITDYHSFENIDYWMNMINNYTEEEVFVTLVGNKSDLVQARVVSTNKGKEKAIKYNCSFLEVSALNSSNVELAFHELVNNIYKKFKDIEGLNNNLKTKEDNQYYQKSKTISIINSQPKQTTCC